VTPFADGVELRRGDTVAVTGASGFIGSAIVRRLLNRGARVVALVEPGGADTNLAGLKVDRTEVDVRSRDDLTGALDGARAVFHTAALFRFWAKDPEAIYSVNVEGTRNVIAAAQSAGLERIVYTSTVATIGLHPKNAWHASDETVPARIDHLHGLYKQSKYVAEHEVLRAAAEGVALCLVHPSFPLGPRDVRPTPTGKVVLDYLNGRMPGYVDTAMNVTHVDDLAEGHVLALERGRQGRSYIIGGENVPMRGLLEMASQCTGLPLPARRWPELVGLGVGYVSDVLEGRLLRREPHVPLEAALMSRSAMIFDDRRARSELGYTSRPATQAVADSARWFVENGYVRPERVDRITWSNPTATHL
jgi:dihydroflavonol-4-reductase